MNGIYWKRLSFAKNLDTAGNTLLLAHIMFLTYPKMKRLWDYRKDIIFRGAELSWQGYSISSPDEKPYVSVDQIVCQNDGDFNTSCQVIYSEHKLCKVSNLII